MGEEQQPYQELVKCVVVGDTAVGKTRLICARACDARITLDQLVTTHIPTVWAIDQYRINKQVLERSWDVVDGVRVSLRLWDTFGDHDRDRRFAYGRSDVVLLCFSISNPLSLRNCKEMWYPEIRRFCPHVPIFLVGCKNDLRFMYRDPKFLSYFQDRSSFMKPVKESDLLTPDQGRSVASEIGMPYYETSVLTNYGIYCVFESVIRAALIARKQQRFCMTSLKRVRKPSLQVPFCPPKPSPPKVYVPPSGFENDIRKLIDSSTYADVTIVVGKTKMETKQFHAHKFLLAAAVPSLYKIFTMDLSSDIPSRRASDSSIVSAVDTSIGSYCVDTEQLIKEDNRSLFGCSPPCYKFPNFLPCTTSMDQESTTPTSQQKNRRASLQASSYPNILEGVFRILNHPAFHSIHLQPSELFYDKDKSRSSLQTIIVLTPSITIEAFEICLKFLYSLPMDGLISSKNIDEVQLAAQLIGINELQTFLNNWSSNDGFMNDVVKVNYINKLQCSLKEMLNGRLFSDVTFQLDGGCCIAHKPLLMARCDMMGAMFGGDFLESSAKLVHFPGVSIDTFRLLLGFLYSANCLNIQMETCVDLIELANKLCLSRLVAIVEFRIISELSKMAESSHDSLEYAIKLLEPCQIFNANQLADWCLHHLATNYNEVCRNVPKLLRNLHPENQAYLNKNRWPPVWYLKEFDHYDRCQREREREEKPLKVLKRPPQASSSGCLCFCSKSRRNYDADKQYSTM